MDEAHWGKKLPFATKLDRVKGLPNPAECQRATDLFLKTQWLLERGGGIVFATGTPIANTIAESWTMARYLMRDKVAHGIVTQLDEDGRLVRLIVFGPSASTLMIADTVSDEDAVPRLEVDAGQAIVALVLANGASSNGQPLGLAADGVWLRTDVDGQPLRVVFELDASDASGVVDLVLHWRSTDASEEMAGA